MRIYLFFLALLFVGTTTIHAQKISATQVPAAVKMTFEARFPTAKITSWSTEVKQVPQRFEYETHNDFKALLVQEVYEASFQLNGQTMSVVITPSGVIEETETNLSTNQLPAAVRATLARDFEAYQVQEAATIVKADGSTVYEAELAQAGKKRDVLFAADGQPAPH
jgi:hypothetical protein